MRIRFVLLLVACVLAWTGLGAADAPPVDGVGAGAVGQMVGVEPAPDAPAHADDRPLQAHGDPSSESLAIVPAPLADRPARVAERHAGAHRAAAAAPYLDGPLRPPRASAPAA
jgi:hypothetical protein